MTFGQGELIPGLTNNIEQEMATRMVGQALDAGVNVFDTADAYLRGESEVILGQALGTRRDKVIIATKVGFRNGDGLTDVGLSQRHIMAAAEASLKRLGTDYIDLYQVHIPDPLTPMEETAQALDDLVRQGKVRYLGYSNFPAWKAARMIELQQYEGYSGFISAQMYYSLLGRDVEYEVAPFVEDAGLGMLVWSPLASGFLSGKYSRDNPVPEGSRRQKFAFPPIDIEKGYRVVDLLQQIGENHNASPAQVAIAWILTKPFVSSVIVGASKLAHLEDNLQAADLRLYQTEVDQLDELTAIRPLYPGWMQGMGWDSQIKAALEGQL
jgi:aryl-alcohol dehydrogenase-like predicted oxidoreductase